ncbi:hypothetical protein BVX98_06200 [bacterium F11]|nr:hypothetical protein BVX98_06200 [bacterium F11]
MYLMYVDESGDPGLTNSPTRYFVLTGLVLHELRWNQILDRLIDFRRRIRNGFNLKLREEIHAPAMINNPGDLIRIPRYNRLAILRLFTREISLMSEINVVNIVVDKEGKNSDYDVFEMAWKALIQRFENTLNYRNFPGPANPDERGLILSDNTDDKKLFRLIRMMRRYNPISHQKEYGPGYRNLAINFIVEDPVLRDSNHSYFIQAADLAAFLLYQKLSPSSYIRKKSAQNYFNIIKPVLCKVASGRDMDGIVWL